MIDRGKLFSSIRVSVFGGRFEQPQVDGINFILDAWEASNSTDLRWLGYMLGTTYAETAHTMQPVHEYGGDAYFKRRYDIEGENPELARRLGNVNPGDGVKFAGRGFVQLTGRTNYEKMTRLTGIDLVGAPDRAMEPAVAAVIMIHGMTGEPGDTFSGVNLQRYFNDTDEDWDGARRIINGSDHAAMIAGYAKAFHDGLDEEAAPAPRPAADPPVVAELPAPATDGGTMGHQKAIGGTLAVSGTQLFDKLQAMFTGVHMEIDTIMLIASIAVALVVWKLRHGGSQKG
jgi:hypothetical protein